MNNCQVFSLYFEHSLVLRATLYYNPTMYDDLGSHKLISSFFTLMMFPPICFFND